MQNTIRIADNDYNIIKTFKSYDFTYYLIIYSDMSILVNSVIKYFEFGDIIYNNFNKTIYSGVIVSESHYNPKDDCSYRQLLYLGENFKTYNFFNTSKSQLRELECKYLLK